MSNSADTSLQRGRLAVNLAEAAIQKRAARRFKASQDADKKRKQEQAKPQSVRERRERSEGEVAFIADNILIAKDFDIGLELGDEEEKVKVDQEIDSLIGMEQAKEMFTKLRKVVAFVEKTGDRSRLKRSLNMVITGAPGVGRVSRRRGGGCAKYCARMRLYRYCRDSISSKNTV